MELHDRMHLARVRAGHANASEFARQVGVAPNSVYRYERGDQSPSVHIAAKWAELTGVTTDWLISGKGEGPKADSLESTGTQG